MAFLRSRAATLRRVADSMLIVVILTVLFGVVLGRVVPMTGRQTLIIAGGSMQPALPIGAAAVVDPVAPTALAVGDVISLRTGAELKSIFTHRITRIVPRADGLWLETKGDANAEVDPSLTPVGQVIGRVTVSIPYAGFLLALLSVPSGVLLVVFVAALLLAITWLIESFEVSRPRTISTTVERDPTLPAAAPGVPAPASVSRFAEPDAIRRRRVRWDALGRNHGSMATAPSPTQVRPTAYRDD
jgi:signal peptidase I